MEKFLTLNKEGFIPGPDEDEKLFLKRVLLTKELYKNPKEFFKKENINPPFLLTDRIKKPDLSWVNPTLFNLFDISLFSSSIYFSDHKLKFFQGAATWFLDCQDTKIPLLQCRTGLKKKRLLGIYELEDILAHELTHFSRVSFNEDIYEEFFAYLTSSRWLRKVFGPVVSSERAVLTFVTLLMASIFFQYLYLFLPFSVFHSLFLISSLSSVGMVGFSLFKLFFRRARFNRCFKRLKKLLGDKKKALSTLFRLKDSEINAFSKKGFDILRYAKEEKSLRWRVIYLSYFNHL